MSGVTVREHAEWHGDELRLRANRAIGRASIGVGEQVSAGAKEIVHVRSGTLRRSIHVSKADMDHFDDEDKAMAGADLDTPGEAGGNRPNFWQEVVADFVALVEVGSWLPYACVEETGRQHFYMSPSFEQVVGTGAPLITIEAAFREEGL